MRQNGLEKSAMIVDSIEHGAILGDKVEKLVELLVFYAFSARRWKATKSSLSIPKILVMETASLMP